MKILCPIDFSPQAELALEEAIHIANATQGSLTILVTYIVPSSSASLLSMDKVIKENTRVDLEKVKAKVLKSLNKHVKLDTYIAKGTPSRVIVDYAHQHQFELIIMGTQGSSNVSNILIGSTTKNVFRSSDTPVLALPVTSDQKGLGKKFVLALDDAPLNYKHTLDIIIPLYKIYKPSLCVYHVSKENDILPIDPIVEEILPDMLDEIIIEKEKNIVNRIKKFVVDNNISLLIMVKRKKSWWEKLIFKGFTEEQFYRTRIPMLILPETE